MGYSPKCCPTGGSLADAEHHERIIVEVVSIAGEPVETVTRTVMTNDGKRYVVYRRAERQVKRMHQLASQKGDVLPRYRLKLEPAAVLGPQASVEPLGKKNGPAS